MLFLDILQQSLLEFEVFIWGTAISACWSHPVVNSVQGIAVTLIYFYIAAVNHQLSHLSGSISTASLLIMTNTRVYDF